MALSYEPLWRFLDQIHLSKMEFAKRIDISNATLAKLGKNEPVTLTIIEKICNEFHCNIKDIVTHVQDTNDIPIDSLRLGTIVTCPLSSIASTTRSRLEKIRHNVEPNIPSVILKMRMIGNKAIILVAPIQFGFEPEDAFDIKFDNAVFLSDAKSGYIQLSKICIVRSYNIQNIMGNIPLKIIESINTGILLDLIHVLLKYDIVSDIPFYNSGFDSETLKNLMT